MSNNYQNQKAIIHVDGDGFFASCEVAQNEALRGKPVVTGQEKGMIIALTYEAKAFGLSRGMLMSDAKKLCPQVIIFPGNYDLYKIMSRRMYAIVRRYAPVVEEYSVDECFGDITSVSDSWEELVAIAHKIQHDLHHDLGMTFSLGLGPTKTLAKVASKWKKPAGFTAISPLGNLVSSDLETKFPSAKKFLKQVPIGAVWGIGRALSLEMQKKHITTALEFSEKSFEWVSENFSKPTQELWYELNGIQMHKVGEGNHEKHKSIRATRTFRPPSKDKEFILSELSRNAEKACSKLRFHELQTRNVYFYLKTQAFTYKGYELQFNSPITTPTEIMNAVRANIDKVFRKGVEYRATGIVLNAISPASVHQPDLFGFRQKVDDKNILFERVDSLYKKYPGSIFLASSLGSIKFRKHNHPKRIHQDFSDLCLKLGIPYWGEVK